MLETGPKQGKFIFVKFFKMDFTGRSVSYRFYICSFVNDRYDLYLYFYTLVIVASYPVPVKSF